MTVWLIGMHFPTFAFWLPAEVGFYQGRAEEVGWPKKDASSEKLAIVGMVGHACDTLLGLLILPISRGAVLGKLWRLESSTLVFVHKMLGYLLLAATFIHAVPFFVSLERNFVSLLLSSLLPVSILRVRVIEYLLHMLIQTPAKGLGTNIRPRSRTIQRYIPHRQSHPLRLRSRKKRILVHSSSSIRTLRTSSNAHHHRHIPPEVSKNNV